MADLDRTNELGGDLVRLGDSDFEVADGYPNIKGWDVVTSDGVRLGKVDDLVVSTSEMRARYVDVRLDREVRDATGGAGGTAGVDRGHALLPIGTAQLDDANDQVIAGSLAGTDLATYPAYAREHGITRDYETSVRDRLGAGSTAAAAAGDFYDHDDYDDNRLFAGRQQGAGAAGGAEQRIRLSEEQLAVGKQQVQAGEVEVRKAVETERVRESVPLTREEVTVERRPLAAGEAAGVEIGGQQELRVPVMREEAVVEKRAVAREQVIIRKQQRVEQQTVEADLRRENLTVDRDVRGERGGAAGTTGTTGTTGSAGGSLADKARNAIDDVKDRVDGNPASKPGPDATDRR